MGIVGLGIPIVHNIQSAQLWPGRLLLLVERVVVVAQIEPIVLREVLIEPEVVLEGVVVFGGVEAAAIHHLKGARRSARGTAQTCRKVVLSQATDRKSRPAQITGRPTRENLRPNRVGIVRLGPLNKSGIFK